MYIITQLDVASNTTKIIQVFPTEQEAINHLHGTVSNLLRSSKDIIVPIICMNNRVEIYTRQLGWIYNAKVLTSVYKIVNHQDVTTIDSSNQEEQ